MQRCGRSGVATMTGGKLEGVNAMRALLLAIAAPIAAFAAAPAAALDPPTAQFTSASSAGSAAGVTVHHGLPPQFRGASDGSGHNGDRRRRRSDTFLIYDRDYQGDTAWRATSYNDWWHERPERAFPRWMAGNQDCQRLWWSGGGWRC
jgi:hypothetical protein